MPRAAHGNVRAIRALQESDRRAGVPRKDGLILVAVLSAFGGGLRVPDKAQHNDVSLFALEAVDGAQEDLSFEAPLLRVRLEDVLGLASDLAVAVVASVLFGIEIFEVALVEDGRDLNRLEKTPKDAELTEVRRQDADAGAAALQSQVADEIDHPARFRGVRVGRMERACTVLLQTVIHEEQAPAHARHVWVLEDVRRVFQLRIQRVSDELADLGPHAPLRFENRHGDREFGEPFEKRNVVTVEFTARRIDRKRVRGDVRAKLKVVSDADEMLHGRDEVRDDLGLEALASLLHEDDRRPDFLDEVEDIGATVRRRTDYARLLQEVELVLAVESPDLGINPLEITAQVLQVGRLVCDDGGSDMLDEAPALDTAEGPDVRPGEKGSNRTIGGRLAPIFLRLVFGRMGDFRLVRSLQVDALTVLVRGVRLVAIIERKSGEAIRKDGRFLLPRGRLLLKTSHLGSFGLLKLDIPMKHVEVCSIPPEREDVVRSFGPLNPPGALADRVPVLLRIDRAEYGRRHVLERLAELRLLLFEVVADMLPGDLTGRTLGNGAEALDVLFDVFALLDLLADFVRSSTASSGLANLQQVEQGDLWSSHKVSIFPAPMPAFCALKRRLTAWSVSSSDREPHLTISLVTCSYTCLSMSSSAWFVKAKLETRRGCQHEFANWLVASGKELT